jgi:putative NADPH-quinone reductase
MSKYISNLLLVLASPINETDKRLSEIANLCSYFGSQCATKGLNVDFLDLYKEKEFLAGQNLDSNDSKVLEYQIRINKADMIAIFHPVWLDSVPAVLKGWLENTMTNNFAYRTENRFQIPLLKDKKCVVVAFDEKTKFQNEVLFGNQLSSFWYKSIFDLIGIDGKLETFYSYRSANDKDMELWKTKINSLSNQIKIKPTILDI